MAKRSDTGTDPETHGAGGDVPLRPSGLWVHMRGDLEHMGPRRVTAYTTRHADETGIKSQRVESANLLPGLTWIGPDKADALRSEIRALESDGVVEVVPLEDLPGKRQIDLVTQTADLATLERIASLDSVPALVREAASRCKALILSPAGGEPEARSLHVEFAQRWAQARVGGA